MIWCGLCVFFYSVLFRQINDQIRISFRILNTFHKNESRTDVNCVCALFFFFFFLNIQQLASLYDSGIEKKNSKNIERGWWTIFAKEFDYTVCFYDEAKTLWYSREEFAWLYDWIDCDRLGTSTSSLYYFYINIARHQHIHIINRVVTNITSIWTDDEFKTEFSI